MFRRLKRSGGGKVTSLQTVAGVRRKEQGFIWASTGVWCRKWSWGGEACGDVLAAARIGIAIYPRGADGMRCGARFVLQSDAVVRAEDGGQGRVDWALEGGRDDDDVASLHWAHDGVKMLAAFLPALPSLPGPLDSAYPTVQVPGWSVLAGIATWGPTSRGPGT